MSPRIIRCPRCQERFDLFECRTRWLRLVFSAVNRRGVRCWRCGRLFSVPRHGWVLDND